MVNKQIPITEPKTFIALFRGINVGGHHKVSMDHLKNEFIEMNFSNISTILNSGKKFFCIFSSEHNTAQALQFF